MGRFVLGITGASGAVVGVELLKRLLMHDNEVYLVISKNGKDVLKFELDKSFDKIISELRNKKLFVEDNDDFFSKISSGSFQADAMIIAPCSMGTVGKIAAGTSDNLMIRAADVAMKEKRKLVLCVRETPFNSIHLENMLRLSNFGVSIMPICPLFYNKPKDINNLISDYVDKVLRLVGQNFDDKSAWNGK
jgi:flavin prenyltransferase